MVSSLGGGTKSPQRKKRRRETIHMKFNCNMFSFFFFCNNDFFRMINKVFSNYFY